MMLQAVQEVESLELWAAFVEHQDMLPQSCPITH